MEHITTSYENIKKPTLNPEYPIQEKVFKRAFSYHQSITIGGHPSTLEERWSAFAKYHEEFDKWSATPEFLECIGCSLRSDTSNCIKCLDLFYVTKKKRLATTPRRGEE